MGLAIGLGLMDYPFASAAGFWRWVDLCEQAGADSLWQTDRLVSRAPILECLTMLAAVAGRTRRLKFGMNVLSLAQREPVLVAKQCATIDMLSEGRLLPAFGIGSPLAPEWAAMGLDTATRGGRTDEALEVITRLWREESVDFAGRHFRLAAASIAPRPAQAALPVWIGGSSPAAIRRTARFGTGWQAGGETPEEAGEVIAAIRREAAALGRRIDADHYGAGFAFWFGRPEEAPVQQAMAAYRARTGRDPARGIVAGGAEEILARIAGYAAAGVSKFILRPLGRGNEAPLAQTRLLLEQVLPRLGELRPAMPPGPPAAAH
ncbi:LLM class flavin-dependent oxidoreductase [Roseicella frigidaeris]|uniref:TIGR03854 family LLM class F420-dependent oxidoreductase n=1 Tax=Roseicella frigidaeris TaxID=2230885 RepID=A0A327MC24_9PROT|nr:LLM class flavin-dependent oxidoreductase [Roseicella frigidaeris]RAI59966.1 TIGR03854 family LLM class F420-dependent oxidoreductase [Roseicella frigidaeris]